MLFTKVEILEVTKELWEWLRDNPNKIKEEWPGWIKYGVMVCNCPCCHYDSQFEDDVGCSNCPLLEKWKIGLRFSQKPALCQVYSRSPWRLWINASNRKEKYNAAIKMLEIIDLTLSEEKIDIKC